MSKRLTLPGEAQQLLGELPDAEIARIHRLSVHRVEAARRHVAIPPASRSEVLPQSIVDRLGQVSDRDLAKEAGLSCHTVRRRRTERGIPAFNPTRVRLPEGLAPALVAKLDHRPDSEIAAEAGVPQFTIRAVRVQKGIGKKVFLGGTQRFVFPVEQEALLGTMRDTDLAVVLGISHELVGRRRKELSIARWTKGATPLDAAIETLLGREPDRSLSKRSGLAVDVKSAAGRDQRARPKAPRSDRAVAR